MARILAIDYGAKRTGIAVTDPLQIIGSALTTVPTTELLTFIQQYLRQEEVEAFVVGEPLGLDGLPTDATGHVYQLVQKLKDLYPNLPVHLQDERYTSKDASRALYQSGVPKMKRRQKDLIDQVSAAIILQEFLEARRPKL